MTKSSNAIRAVVFCTATALAFAPGLMFGQRGAGVGAGQSGGGVGGGSAGGQATAGSANDSLSHAATAGQMNGEMQDRDFVAMAAKGGMADVKMGELAAQKGSSDQVKQFGQKMVDDHTKLNEQIAPIAASMGVKPPTKLDKKDQKEYDKLNGLTGAAFDKQYVVFELKDHEKTLSAFRQEETTTTNAQLKQAVGDGTQVINGHLAMVKQLAQQMGVSKGGKQESGD